MAEVPVALARKVTLLSGLSLLAGLFLALSPLLNGYWFSSSLTTLNVSLGLLIAVAAYFRCTIGQATPWLAWFLIGLGVITLITPWTMNYAFLDSFRNQHLVVGGIVVVFETLSALLTHAHVAKARTA